ncbi:MAG: hypothetical protein P1V51_23140 [Deltaproteobacteria bacterium]|nr:hypothetical protein [Deltaproteobacteria bacterium]
MRTNLRTLLLSLPALLLFAGCPAEVDGPVTVLPAPLPGTPLPADPALICRDQLETSVVVRGVGFSPVPIGIPHDPRTALPSITLSRRSTLDGQGAEAFSFTYPGDPNEPNSELLSWQGQEQMTLVVNQSLLLAADRVGLLEDGIFDITVTNPNGNEGRSLGALAVAPRPTLTGAAPTLLCLAQGPRDLVLSGTTFLRDEVRLPTLTTGASRFDQVVLSGCADIDHAGIAAEVCDTATYTLPDGSLAEGTHDLVLTNPEAAACHTEELVTLRVVPPPSISVVEPALVCTADGTRDVIVRGADFLNVDGVPPTATVGGTPVTVTGATDCAPLPTTGLTVLRCDTLALTLPQGVVTAPEEPELVVTNPDPAGCSGSATALLGLMPPPVITDVQPPALCDDGSDATLVLTGTDFTVLGTTPPTVRVDGSDAPTVTASDCTPQTVAGQAVELCTTLTATFPTTGFTGTEVRVEVENPDPVGCISTWADPLPLMTPPAILSAVPALVCTEDGSQAITITGTEFLVVGGQGPAVTLGGTAVTSTVTAASCTPTTIGPVAAERCTELVATAPQGSLVEGDVEVTVTNPPPLVCGGSSSAVLDAPPPLTIVSTAPSGMCEASPPTQVTITGTGFLDVDGALPTVTFGGSAVTVDGLGTCQDLTVAGQQVQACEELLVTLQPNTLPTGDVEVIVTNPGLAACTESATGVFSASVVPSLTSVVPTEFCTELGGTLTLTGTGFYATTSVTLTDAGGAALPADSVTFVSDTELEASWGVGLPRGSYDLTVSNGPSCDATLPGAVSIEPRPFVFFIDPPVAYNGVAIQATIYSDGLTSQASSVRLLGPNGEVEALSGSSVAGRPNQIFVTIPAGLAPGTWDVEVTSTTGCLGTLVGGLEITNNTSLALAGIDPPFGSTNLQTPVIVTARPDPLGAGEVDFVSTPRAYLNPNPSGPGTTAAALQATVHVDAKTLTAVVPPGLATGSYDLIVVNPNATVGVVSNAFTINANDPPVVTAVVPGSLDANATVSIEVQGQAFDTVGGATVDLICRDPAGVIYTGSAASPVVVDPTSTTATVNVGAIVDGGGGAVSAGAVCVVRLTNFDGAHFDYSAISIKTPSQNLNSWTGTAPMLAARRGLGLQAGRPTATSRYLYAIGGDDGALAGARSTVEGVNVGVYGQLSSWVDQRNGLQTATGPAPRTLAGHTKIGRFLYAVGGHDGAAPVATILRAQILDPLATPEVVDLSLDLGEGSGLAPGFYSYRIAATFPTSDGANPGGESLPGEVLGVLVPDISGVELTLVWDAIPGADGYRVYRTPTAGASVDTAELLATVSGTTTYVDTGADTTTAGALPLPPGSLGRWHEAGMSLGTPRYRLAAASGPDPALPGTHYLYAFGGDDGAGNALASVEVFTVQVTPPALPKASEQQTLTAAGLTTAALPSARESHGTFVVSHDDFAVVPTGSTWIYVGPGEDGAGASVAEMNAFEVAAGGDITTFLQVSAPNGRERAGAADGNGFLFLIGGAGALTSGVSARLCAAGDPGCTGGPPEPPDLQNWNGLGISLSEGREDPGMTQESAFFFIAGGFNGTAVTNSVDQTVK